MDVTYTDAELVDVGELKGFRLDIEEGDERNDFELSLDIDGGARLEAGALVYVDGTEWGGVVDEDGASPSDGLVLYRGRTWTGVLADKVIEPNAGQSHLSVSGEANAVLLQLIERMGLSGRFTVPSAASGIQVSHTFDRYCTGYAAIRAMLAGSGAKLMVRCNAGVVELSAAPIDDYSDGPDTDRAKVEVDRVFRPYNHLISLGSGEGAQRIVRHDYADADGNVSQTQTLFGIDERTATYDYSNADAEELAEKGPEKLKELQAGSSWSASLNEEWDYDIGDVVPGIDVMTGSEVYATVGGKIATITDKECSIEYKAGGTAAEASLSGSSESSGGGISYSPGKGIDITGGIISADVDQADLDEVSQRATNAYNLASNAGTEAASKVASVTGASPISASMDDDHNVTVQHVASGVIAGSYGPTANPAPGWGDEVTLPPQVSIDAKGHITGATSRKMTIPDSTATQSADGLMAKGDKVKLDGVESGATKTEVDGALSSSSANPVANSAVTNALNGKAPASHDHSADDITEGVIPASRGGTGVSTAQAERNRLGLGNTTGAVPVANGGTGATTAAQARTNLGVTLANLGVSATAAELNKLDGATVTTDEINCLEGVESDIQAQLDGKAPASHTHLYAGSSSAGGAATSAEKLKTARKITFTGAATGSFTFDGSKDTTVVLQGDSEAAGFLAAHPVGSVYETTNGTNPGVTYGGTWVKQPGNMGCLKWERTA